MKENIKTKTYWKGFEELRQDEDFVNQNQSEFPEYLPLTEGENTNRRDFLKLLGFGVAAVSLAACETPVKKAIPYLNKPESIDPGVPNYYASTYYEDGEYCSVLVKTREGRPIKIEGNTLSNITKGGTSARVQSSVLSLYDNSEYRAKKPMAKGKEISWSNLDAAVASSLNEISAAGGQIRIVSNSIISPSLKSAIAGFLAKYPTASHVVYDSNSSSALLDANMAVNGVRAVPGYNFANANSVVSVAADFLGTWISPAEYSNQYSAKRKISNKSASMSKHYHFESLMSLTGANADKRYKIKPSQEAAVVANIYNEVASAFGGTSVSAPALKGIDVKEAAKSLIENKGKALLVAGTNDVNVQILVALTNKLLETSAIEGYANYLQGNDSAMSAFVNDLSSGAVSGVIFMDCNPVYDHKEGKKIEAAIKKSKLTVSTSAFVDETAALCGYVAPKSSYLESWGDAEPKNGVYSLVQPTIKKIFDSREEIASLLTWSGDSTNVYDYVRNYWKNNILGAVDFNNNWNKSLHDGVYANASTNNTISNGTPSVDLASVSEKLPKEVSGMELKTYQKVAIGSGRQANNPWLQECPDPITKAVWDNYVIISYKTATELSVKQDDVVTVSDGTYSVNLPVFIQPGQIDNVIGIAVGYGRSRAGKAGNGIGQNAYPFNTSAKIIVTKGTETRKIAQTQTFSVNMDRKSIIQESTLKEFKDNPSAGRFFPLIADASGAKKAPAAFDLWGKHEYKNHHWGMVIDLNSCTGCSACVIACHSENNVPVVGRQEVINRRDMHWMRIDRYYSTNSEFYDSGQKTFGMNDDVERILAAESENPQVVFQPMMCQHCNHASCETVCPVAATTHSDEGINQMAYNRCIGTRYCANNCPYKVRRFNWFNYTNEDRAERGIKDVNPAQDDLMRMVLNPDVTVRTRGVMEKCSLCIQRIQYGKLEAKKAGRRTNDSDVVTACAQSCPTNAITFGDMNNPESKISQMLAGEQKERAYVVLEELNEKPNVSYLTKIRNLA